MKRSYLFIVGLVLAGLIIAGVGAGVSMQQSPVQNEKTPVAASVNSVPASTLAPTSSPTLAANADVDQSNSVELSSVLTINVVQTPGFDSPGSVVYVLPSNPTTGYQWEVISKEGLNVDDTFIPSNSNLIGAGGAQKFTITADKAGTYTFKAAYKRSGDDSSATVFEQEITLNPANKDEVLELNFSGNMDVKTGEIVNITVCGNPTTGYTWNDFQSEGLKLVNSVYLEDEHEEGMTGVPGKYYWSVTADKAGKYTFSMQYGRSWENTYIAHASFNIVFSNDDVAQSNSVEISPEMTINVVETPGFDSPGSVVYVLPSNPTTGYQWEVISKEGLNVDDTFIPSNSGLIGAGGAQKFTITADKAGTYTFKAAYKRSGDESSATVFEQEITLNPANKDDVLELNFSGNMGVKAGEIVNITVCGNPTTGYSWNEAPSEGLKVVNSDYIVDDHEEGMVGVPGKYYWSVTAEKPGKYTFSMQYGRPWEDTYIGHAYFDIVFS